MSEKKVNESSKFIAIFVILCVIMALSIVFALQVMTPLELILGWIFTWLGLLIGLALKRRAHAPKNLLTPFSSFYWGT